MKRKLASLLVAALMLALLFSSAHSDDLISLEDAPADETSVPEDDTPAPEDDTPAPADETPAPEDETPAPEDDTPAPADETPAPTDETPAPADETPAPADETPAPADDTPAPADETPAPADETPAPADETLAPADEMPAPEDETPTPADETPAPEEEAEVSLPNVIIFSSLGAMVEEGAPVVLSSRIEGLSGGEQIFYQWECDRGNGFEPVPGANGAEYTYAASADSLRWNWRLKVTIG